MENRKDYKGYDRTRGSSFNSWRAIINTEKGRASGFPAEWRDFSVFMKDVQGVWSRGMIVRRLDSTLPHSKTNSVWSEKGSESIGKLTKLEFNGVEKTLLEWCGELNLNYQGVRQRYFRGKDLSPEEILFGKTRHIRTPQERNFAFRTARMCGAYRLKDKNKNRGNDVTVDFLRSEIQKGCVYCGDMEKVGLDRLDNSKGHTRDNVVPCCSSCNSVRMDHFSFDEMIKIGKVISEIKRSRNEKNK